MDSLFDEKPIRNTIKILHKKLAILFYLDNEISGEIFDDINNSIINCSDSSISLCVDIIISPILMAIHNCIQKLSLLNSDSFEDSKNLAKNTFFLKSKKKNQIEQLLVILRNVLQKLSFCNKILTNRLSTIFFDIMLPTTQIINIFLFEKNEFVLEKCIEVVELNFCIFWKYWKYKENKFQDQSLIFPIIMQYMITIALPNQMVCEKTRNLHLFSKNIKKLILNLFIKIPNIVTDAEMLLKVYPGTIQALAMQILTANLSYTSFETLELFIIAFTEWVNHCLNNKNSEFLESEVLKICTKNTGKILKHLFRTKSFEFMFYYFCTDYNKIIDYNNYSALRKSFSKIAFICLTESFNNFFEHSNETLTLCLDFLFSMKCDYDISTDKLIYEYLNILLNENNLNWKLFLFEYFKKSCQEFNSINLKSPNLGKFDKLDFMNLIRSISKLVGIFSLKMKFLKFDASQLNIESILSFFFEIITSSFSLNNYQESITRFKKIKHNGNYFSKTEFKNSYSANIDIITDIVTKIYSKSFENKNCTKSKSTFFEGIQIFKIFDEILLSTFTLNTSKLNDYKISIPNIILNAISILILNSNDDMICCKNILKLIQTQFFKLNTFKVDHASFFLEFIFFSSFLNSTQILLNIMEEDTLIKKFNVNLSDKIPNILFNWFDFSTQKLLEMKTIDSKYRINEEINIAILLTLIGNIIKVVKHMNIEKDSFLKKLNVIINTLFSLLYNEVSFIRDTAIYTLNQFFLLNEHSQDIKDSIQILSKEYSIELLRPLEIVLYGENLQERVKSALTSLENCELEFLFGLSDIFDRIHNIDIKNNTWIFGFLQTVSRRFSEEIGFIRKIQIDNWILENNQDLSNIKEKIDKYFINVDKNLKELLFTIILQAGLINGNRFSSNKIIQTFIPGNISDFEKIPLESDSLCFKKCDMDFKLAKMRNIASKIIPLVFTFSNNVDEGRFCILGHQHLSSSTLLDCMFILSTDARSLLPYANNMISHIIDPWNKALAIVLKERIKFSDLISLKLREIEITNVLLFQLIASCGCFIINKLESELILPILLSLEKIFEECEHGIFMDEKEAKYNSEIYKLTLLAFDFIFFFTKYYIRLNTSEIKFEVINKIVQVFLSRVIGKFSLKLRLIAMKILICIYITHPHFLRIYLSIIDKKNLNIHIKETKSCLNLIEKNFLLKGNDVNLACDFFSRTESEVLLQTRLLEMIYK